ncbi:GNAT family N-acetyltransferase [Deefgea rivuli]|uniref:GNAT family N-acetyltransferase n=1 Tax=Deefgea rivuli TaxID=400948 RepID=UPI000481C49B|nr:GNAT family protein [Deefgea rivuli]
MSILLQQANLIIRPFIASDAADFVAAVHESMMSLGRWLPWCHAEFSEQDALGWFAHCEQTRTTGSAYSLGIFSADGRELIGGVGLNEIIRHNRSSANLGYWVRESRQRQGIATQAIQMISQFGFQELDLLRIEIVAIDSNTASNAAAKKSGAQFECLARNRLILNGVAHTAAVYSLIPEPTSQSKANAQAAAFAE